MKKEIIVTVLLAIVVVALILGMKFATGSFEESDARKFVTEDLTTKFPGADKIEVVNFEQMANVSGGRYYSIKAAVIAGISTPCPTRTNYYYNYPVQNFVPAPPEYAVKNCRVCESSPCVIAFPEEAIIASHTLAGSQLVQQYITASRDAMPKVNRTQDTWTVAWTSSLDYGYKVAVSDNGTIESVEKI
ncbi:Uncharacterised protein [uncultured archaeon]|nr:Uncharacterised protein [uncultured archaeon]